MPTVAWVYGGLGLFPFFATAAGAWAAEGSYRSTMQSGLLIYGCLILTFLGGARWGFEVGRVPVRSTVISASMAGAVLSTALIATPGTLPTWQLVVLALAHLAQWAWDVRASQAPRWYSQLRHPLTAGAVASLLLGAAASLRA